MELVGALVVGQLALVGWPVPSKRSSESESGRPEIMGPRAQVADFPFHLGRPAGPFVR